MQYSYKNIKKQAKFSQNFLVSGDLVDVLIKLSKISYMDYVVEVGGGKGIITERLANLVSNLVVYEVDLNLNRFLSKKFQNKTNVQIVYDDFLFFSPPKSDYKIFSNIPFNYTSKILKKLYLYEKNPPAMSYLIMQKEAYLRFSGFEKETQISLLLKPFFEFKLLYKFQKNDFYPIPKVEAVFVEISKINKPVVEYSDIELYRDFIVFVTSVWSETSKGCLKKIFSNKQLILLSKTYKFNLQSEILNLNFEQFLNLFNFYLNFCSTNKKDLVLNSYTQKLIMENKLDKIYRNRHF